MKIYIEGNIGAGKSTVVDYLNKTLSLDEYEFLVEPVSKWLNYKDEDKCNLLDNFYKTKTMGLYISNKFYFKYTIFKLKIVLPDKD